MNHAARLARLVRAAVWLSLAGLLSLSQAGAQTPAQDGTSGATGQPGYLGMIADDRQAAAGVQVINVVPGGPADLAGLQKGDRITSINALPVASMRDMAQVVRRSGAGSKLRLVIVRKGRGGAEERLTSLLTMGVRPPVGQRLFPDFGRIGADEQAGAAGASITQSLLGVRTAPLDEATRQKLNVPVTRGAVVVEVTPGLPAAGAGIAVGSVIIAVDNRSVDSPAGLAEQLQEVGAGGAAELALFRGEKLVRETVRLALVTGNADIRIEGLERRVRQLEERIAQLEAALQAKQATENEP